MPFQRGQAGLNLPKDSSAFVNSSVASYCLSAKTTLRWILNVMAAKAIILLVYAAFLSVMANPLKTLLWQRTRKLSAAVLMRFVTMVRRRI